MLCLPSFLTVDNKNQLFNNVKMVHFLLQSLLRPQKSWLRAWAQSVGLDLYRAAGVVVVVVVSYLLKFYITGNPAARCAATFICRSKL